MDLGLNGKRALVVASSEGLGYATALALSREGARVVINARHADKLDKAVASIREDTGGEVFGIPADISKEFVSSDLVNESATKLAGLDLLVTNSGGPPAGEFESFDDDDWENAINLTFTSHVRLIRAALPHLRKSSSASVLTITSYAAKQPVPNLVLSSSIRAATLGLTKSLSQELGSEGIRFNSILPGWIETARVQKLLKYRAEKEGTSVEEQMTRRQQESALQRMGTPQEFANAAVFLLSPAASYVTGVMMLVDGGISKGTW